MAEKAINHCGMSAAVQDARMSKEDIQEAIMERAGEIVTSAYTGKPQRPHKFSGIELMAQEVAKAVLANGAEMMATDLGINLAEMKELAKSEHISSC